ncbi:MAG: hypothetical protein AAGJ10_10665 [Bacteroidota bacterium]
MLILSGTVGAGKTTIGHAVHEILSAKQVPHAFLDVDRLGDTWPQHGRFNQGTVFSALSALWPVYRKAGAARLVLAYVVEDQAELARYEAALGPCTVAVVRLTASTPTLRQRITTRETGEAQRWHLQRAAELEGILDTAQPYGATVQNDGQTPHEVGQAVLRCVGW